MSFIIGRCDLTAVEDGDGNERTKHNTQWRTKGARRVRNLLLHETNIRLPNLIFPSYAHLECPVLHLMTPV